MKILLSADVNDNLKNGVASVVDTLYTIYKELGHDVRILELSGDRQAHKREEKYLIGSFSTPYYPEMRQGFSLRHPYLKELIKWKPDIIHAHTEAAAMWMVKYVARANDTPVVMTNHTDYARQAFGRWHESLPVRLAIKGASAVVYRNVKVLTVPSQKALDLAKGYVLDCPVVIIHNGIRLEDFQGDLPEQEKKALFEKYHLSEQAKLLVCVTRVSKEKNLSELLAFMPALLEKDPAVRLMITGDGPDMAHIRQEARDLHLQGKVVFTGKVDRSEVSRYYKMGSVFVSASDFEIQSMTYLEAMACGLPLLCRDDTSLEGMLIHGENGYRYRTREEYVRYALELLNDPEKRRQMGAASLRTVDNYTDVKMAKRMLALYRKVLERMERS